MSVTNWRERAAIQFNCEKQAASGAGGVVVANHPMGSAAGAEMLAAGGNAVDAAIATLFTLTVVEPMMVGIFGGGMAHVRFPDGTHLVLDGQARAPLAMASDHFTPISDEPGKRLETEGRRNAVGIEASAAPGSLKGWCELHRRFGRLPFVDVIEPAIKHAERGFTATAYLTECIGEARDDIASNPALTSLYLNDGDPIAAGTRVVQGDYAETLRQIQRLGPDALYKGPVGDQIAAYMAANGGVITQQDFDAYATIDRDPVRADYRGFEIVGPPPPSSGGVHVIQMLNVLEGFDLRSMGFGSGDATHLLAEVLKIAFADRAVSTADPDFVDVPVARLIDKAYAEERRAHLKLDQATTWTAAVAAPESNHTTHVTTADRDGMVVATTQTINSLFGARYIIPETGIIGNNYMAVYDPHPGRVQSIEPGKRIPTSMAPVMALQNGAVRFALGLPGGLRIFGSAMQALVNMIDHGMSLQEAVEAPRIWTQGQNVEIEEGYGTDLHTDMQSRGHQTVASHHVGGGMNGIAFADDGTMTGAACWRADGTPIAVGGGLARAGVRFWPD